MISYTFYIHFLKEEIMKYKHFAFFFVLIAILVSCQSTKIIYDDSIPPEETATVTPSMSTTVISFNGKKVNWTTGTWTNNDFIIPSGEAELIIDIAYHIGNTIYTGGKLKVNYNFLKGNKYLLVCVRVYPNDVEADIEIRNLTTNTKEVIRAKSNNK